MTQFAEQPDQAQFIYADIANFWEVFDQSDKEDAQETIERCYFQRATPGLSAFIAARIGSSQELLHIIKQKHMYYNAIRDNTLQLHKLESQIRDTFQNLKSLLETTVFPPTYFVIGCFSSGGIAFPGGQVIGTEFFARDEQTPTHELNQWELGNTRPLTQLPAIIAHELIHFVHSQHQPELKVEDFTVLDLAVVEGLAEYFGEVISKQRSTSPHMLYGYQHEHELWQRFSAEMHTNKTQNWFYQGSNVSQEPADLGYFIGYRIVQHFVENAKDKQSAFLKLLTTKSFVTIFEQSGYRRGL